MHEEFHRIIQKSSGFFYLEDYVMYTLRRTHTLQFLSAKNEGEILKVSRP